MERNGFEKISKKIKKQLKSLDISLVKIEHEQKLEDLLPAPAVMVSSDSESESESESEAADEEIEVSVVEQEEPNVPAVKSTAERFKRVREEEVEFVDERLKDNSYLSKPAAVNTYGYKAYQDLSVTKGKGFLKAKNKKKRGSYRGGPIDTGSHSIKFDD